MSDREIGRLKFSLALPRMDGGEHMLLAHALVATIYRVVFLSILLLKILLTVF